MSTDKQSLAEAKTFLQKNNIASLATIAPPELVPQPIIEAVPESTIEASPEVVCIYYYYDGAQSIYFATVKDSRKIQNITNNKNVALTIYHALEGKELQLKGMAHIIDNPDDTINFLTSIHKVIKNDIETLHGWPLIELNPEQITVVQVVIEEFKYSHFREHATIIAGSPDEWLS